ncbi:MAG: outer membrane lipoprotein-sorting protein [Gammaproteobacteria bacterium]|nr:outer membrane lipoprotein-sorting protein [Gammaproteobacteria bacterium]
MRLPLLLIPLLLLTGNSHAEATLDTIQSCMVANIPTTTAEQSVRLRSIDRAGSEQALSARLWWRHKEDKDTRLMARIDAPLDLEGAAYLAIQEEGEQTVYSYIPAIKRVHRIKSGNSKGKLWGTDFSYEDIRYLQAVATSGELSVEGEGSYGERKTWIVTMVPSDPSSSYQKVVNQVDQETCVPLMSELYEQGGEPRKILSVDPLSLSQIGDRWLARRASMEDKLNETRTEIEITRVEYDDKISARTFSPSNFYKVR